MIYYHFLRADGCLNYPPHTKVEVGQTLRCDGPLELCVNGMHASKRVIDALEYAPGEILCEVELGGGLLEGEDKVCARSRTVLSIRDITPILHEFACRIAEQALKDHNVTDERSWNAIATKRRWLIGDATDAELGAARETAWAAARDAAWVAAWAAARDAAGDAQNTLLMQMLEEEEC